VLRTTKESIWTQTYRENRDSETDEKSANKQKGTPRTKKDRVFLESDDDSYSIQLFELAFCLLISLWFRQPVWFQNVGHTSGQLLLKLQ